MRLKKKGAFRKNGSCTDKLFTVRMLHEKVIERNKE